MDFFYDSQIRRLILQVARTFGGFVVETGQGANGKKQFRQVPARYGEMSRMIGHILRQMSENKTLYTPFISVYITSINMAPDRRQNPFLIRTDQVDERKFDQEKQEYGTTLGDRFTLKRHMPVPYNFTFQVDIWTSNIEQKMQLIEQIMMLFNPAQKLQSSDNPLDWTAITDIEMQDTISWTSKSVPLGTDEQIDVSSMQFLIPYWINPPVELRKRKVIETIINNIRAVQELPENDSDFAWEQGDLLSQLIFTPNDAVLNIADNVLTLLNSKKGTLDENGNIFNWVEYINLFGPFRNGSTKITVKRMFGDPDGITGTISLHPTNVNQLIWTVDQSTLPANTLSDINAIIDPLERYPGDGILLPAAIGQRYLLANDMNDQVIGGPNIAWGNINAFANDIIEYNGTEWIISFNSQTSTTIEVVKNSFNGKQFRWNFIDKNWETVIDGDYNPGTWKIIL